MKLPWKSFAQAEMDKEYLALLSYLPLRQISSLPRFLVSFVRIQRQLRSAKGLIGYSLEVRLLKGQFWTLSVWEGNNALREFVNLEPHSGVMRAFSGKMEKTAFIRWQVAGSQLPPSWEVAHEQERLAQIQPKEPSTHSGHL